MKLITFIEILNFYFNYEKISFRDLWNSKTE